MPGGCDVAKGAAASTLLSQALLHAEVRRLYYSQGAAVPSHLISTLCPRQCRVDREYGSPPQQLQSWACPFKNANNRRLRSRVPTVQPWPNASNTHTLSRPQLNASFRARPHAELIGSKPFYIHSRAHSSVPVLEPTVDETVNHTRDDTMKVSNASDASMQRQSSKAAPSQRNRSINIARPSNGQQQRQPNVLAEQPPVSWTAPLQSRDAPISRVEKAARSHNKHLRTKRDYLVTTHLHGWDPAVWQEILTLLEKESQPLPSDYQALLITGHTRDIYELRIAIENATGDRGLHAAISIWRNPDDSVLKVYGLPSAIENVRNIILRRVRTFPSEVQPSKTWSDGVGGRVRRYRLPARPFERDEPKGMLQQHRWTKRSFLRYVVMLTTRSPSAPYVDKGQHVEEVAASLKTLFGATAEANSVATELAFNRAIGYLLHHMRIPQAQDLLDSMEKLGIEPTVGIYNLFVDNCAQRMDQSGTRRYLHALLEHGRPNAETWGALVWLSATHTKLKQVYHGLARLGYLDVTAVSAKIVPHLIHWALDPFYDRSDELPNDTRKYIEAADRLFGPAWLSSEALTSLLNVLGLRGWVTEAARLVESFRADRSLAPSVLHLNMLLVHCKRLRLADTAVDLVNRARGQWGISTFTSKTYLHLFRTATTAKLYNLSKVIWLYASLEGQIHHKMMSIMHRGYVRTAEASGEDVSVRQRWRGSFAPVVTGWEPPKDASFNDAMFSHFSMQRSLYGTFKAGRPFAQMLEEALALDKKWIAAGHGKSNDLAWKMRNSIGVPLIRLDRKELSPR